MLAADKKRKVQYILNPRNCSWSADESNVGRRLMERMGWSDGRGLGRNEQGVTQNIKVAYKCDSKGMGFKAPKDDSVKQQDEFSELLAQLNQSPDVAQLPEVPSSSLEERSEKTRSRVHYKKFTRGKDLSRYSSKDLACILGTGQSKQPKEEKKEEEEIDSREGNTFGVPTTCGGLIDDYFKKMRAKKLQMSGNNFENGSECSDQHQIQSLEGNEVDPEEGTKKKKKKRKSKHVELTNDMLVTCDSVDDTISKKKKRKIVEAEPETNYEEIETNASFKKSKKKKKETEIVEAIDSTESNSKKLKKKKRKMENIESDERDNSCNDVEKLESEVKLKKKKKRKNNWEVTDCSNGDINERKKKMLEESVLSNDDKVAIEEMLDDLEFEELIKKIKQ